MKNQLIGEIERLRDERGFIRAGLPRFNNLFARDALIVSWQLLDFEPEICRQTLAVLSDLQGKKIKRLSEEEPGRIPHQEKYGPLRLYYGSVDATPLYLILFALYFEKTRDINFLKAHWENIKKSLNWLIEYGDKDGDGFLEYRRKTPFGLFHQGWKDGYLNILSIKPPVAIVEVQGYQYSALKKIARIAELLGDNDLASHLEKRAERLKKDFNEKFWLSEEKYFALALDGKKNQRRAITSNPGHLLFTGLPTKDKADLVVKRLFAEDLWTPFGIRTHSEKEPDFNNYSYHLGSVWPHDNWLIAQGLKELGYKEEYLQIKNALLAAHREIGFIPELFTVSEGKIVLEMYDFLKIGDRTVFKVRKPICYPQAWASGALLNFLTNSAI